MNNQDSKNIHKTLIHQNMISARGILHMGAHLGQERNHYEQIGKPVVWVEALPYIHARLVQNLSTHSEQMALCALLGERNGLQMCFHISNNHEGVSSSIYPFGPFGSGDKSIWPSLKLEMVDNITLPSIRLDTLLKANNIPIINYDYWVIDLQGAELLALKGAGELIEQCSALYVEVSTVEVYQNGVLWPELNDWISKKGFFPLWEPESPHDDVLFIRKTKLQSVESTFHTEHYFRHNQRRLEHLASLGLDLLDKHVLEIGSGIGDHTSFYLDRGCEVVVTEVRPENLFLIRKRFANNSHVEVLDLDIEYPRSLVRKFDIVHCYGLLYHLQQPEKALAFLAEHCKGILILETCVSFGSVPEINLVNEPEQNYSQSFYGTGCRPTRSWLWNILNLFFEYVYIPRTQPAHEEFPLDWTLERDLSEGLKRSVFVGSRMPINNPLLVNKLINRQYRS
jgi:FkbM family methyltransferase